MELPIIKLRNIVISLLSWVKSDLISNELTPDQSWLYLEFNDQKIEGRNFYEELRDMILLGKEDARSLRVKMMFDTERTELPTIHINYPAENLNTGDNFINTGAIVEELAIPDGEDIDYELVDKYSRSAIGQYELIFTGANTLQVIMLYECMMALLIAGADTLTYQFDKFEFSGRQLMLNNQDMLPRGIFYRSISVNLQMKRIVRSIIAHKSASDITFRGDWFID